MKGRRSPLDGVALVDGLRELPFLGQVDVRVDPRDAAAVESVGIRLPLEPNTAWSDGERAALWLGPDEWLVIGASEGSLREALAAVHASVVDVSANRVVLELDGPSAREILEAGCSIDLHPRAFGPGRCAQTLLARANVLLWQIAAHPDPVYRLFVRPSFAAYLAAWIADAAAGLEA